MQIICSDRKQICHTACLLPRDRKEWERMITKGQEVKDLFIIFITMLMSQLYICQNLSNCTLETSTTYYISIIQQWSCHKQCALQWGVAIINCYWVSHRRGSSQTPAATMQEPVRAAFRSWRQPTPPTYCLCDSCLSGRTAVKFSSQ